MSLIESIYKDYLASGNVTKVPAEANNDNINESYLFKVFRAMIFSFGSKNLAEISIIRLSSNPFEIVPYYLIHSKTVIAPALICVDFKNIPSHFTDSQGNLNLSNLQPFADWVCTTFALKKKNITKVDVFKLRLFLEGMKNIEKAKKAFQFSLAHELGHAQLQHGVKEATKNKIKGILTLGIYTLYKNRREEKEADAFGYTKSQEFAEGGAYLFSLLEKGLSESTSDKIIHAALSFIYSVTHTSFSSRLQAIRSHLKSEALGGFRKLDH